MVSGVQFSDLSLTYNTQCSSQQVSSLMSITHLVHPPQPNTPPATISLFSVSKSLLRFASLSLLTLFCCFLVISGVYSLVQVEHSLPFLLLVDIRPFLLSFTDTVATNLLGLVLW